MPPLPSSSSSPQSQWAPSSSLQSPWPPSSPQHPAPSSPCPSPPSPPFAPCLDARPAATVGVVRRRCAARLRCASGQASVEFLAILPAVLVIMALAWQAVLAGQAIWHVRVAARAAARAHSVGADVTGAARSHLPRSLERGLRVTTSADGDVRVSLRVPAVLESLRLGRVSATSHFRPQS